MYVMDETWDMWNKHKTAHDYADRFLDNWKDDLRAMVEKDYNHPAVIFYSIGNEVTEPAEPEGVSLAGKIIREVKKWDETRPVTAGINITLILMASMGMDVFGGNQSSGEPQSVSSTQFNEQVAQLGQRMLTAAASPEGDRCSGPVLDILDIAGYNYAQTRYEAEHTLHPERIVVGSETFPQDLPGNWALVEKCPWVIGDFMWPAWDYLGEVGIGGWVSSPEDQGFSKSYPWKLADSGALDILGHDTAEAGMAAVVWGARKTPYIAVRPVTGTAWYRAAWRGSNAIPSWSWKGCEGMETEVEVYTGAPEAELWINGQSYGRQSVHNCVTVYRVLYQPGEIRAVAYETDGSVQTSFLLSADSCTHIRITPEDRPILGKPLFAAIDICGANGVVESHADECLSVTVKGGKLLAFGSALPKAKEEFPDGCYPTFYGRSMAVLIPECRDAVLCVRGATMKVEYHLFSD